MSLFKGTHTTTKADKINQFQATICEYGAVVPDIVGTTKISPNLINWQDFYSQTLKKTTKQGKAKSTTINYDYYVYMELALAEKITGLGNVWVGDKKYSSLAEANGTTKAEGFPLVLYKDGGMTPYMRDNHSEIAVEYRDLAFLASPTGGNTSATYLGENTASVPSYAFEVKGQLLDTGDGVDINPADYILHILKQVGIWNGEGNEENIVEGIGRYRAYCAGMDMLISSPKEQQQGQAQAVIKSLMDLTDCYFFWSNNRFKVVVKDNRRWPGFTPNTTILYDLTEDDMLPQSNGAVVLFSRKDSSEQYNRFTIQWCNREKDYEDETISYEIIDDIQANGLRQASQISAPYIYKRERAIKACQLQARRAEREKNKYTIKLDWAYAIIEPGDLLTLTDPVIGLNRQPVIVDKVTEAKNGILTVECLQYFEGDYAVGQIAVNNDEYFYVNYNAEPDPTDEPVIFQPPYSATMSGNEIWIALRGTGNAWGGCQVIAANQDNGFYNLAEFRSESQYGSLVAMTDDTMTVSINGDFDNMSEADAEGGKIFFWVDGECIGYRTATYQGAGVWVFGGITRGLYDTLPTEETEEGEIIIVEHEIGCDVVFCDGSLFALELTPSDANTTIYFKFPAMNVFHNNYQDEDECESYSFVVGGVKEALVGDGQAVNLEGNASVTGGAVKLNKDGLTCTDNYGDSVVFDDTGMHFVDADGNEFSAVKRIVMGEAMNGQRVTFAKPFKRSPLVICNAKELEFPTDTTQSGNIKLIANAIDVSPEGFTMQCMTCLDNGATGGGVSGISVYKGKQWKWTNVISDNFQNPAGDHNAEVTLCIKQEVWGSVRDSSLKGGRVEFTVEWLDGTVLYQSPLLEITTKSPHKPDGSMSEHYETSTEYVTITMGPWWDCRVNMHYWGNDWSSYARVTIESYTYKILDRIVLSEGTASFIATDTEEYYTTSTAAAMRSVL